MNKNIKKILIALCCTAFSAFLAVGFAGCSKTLPQWIREQQCGEHEWNDGEVTKAATCTEEGESLFTCETCGATETQAIAMLPHNEKEVAETPSTCTAVGYTDGVQCVDCQAWVVGHEVIPMKEHDVVVQSAVEATCLTKGKTEGSYCATCETVFEEQEEIAALGHQIVVKAGYAATCTVDGMTQGQECTRCGKVYLEQEVIEATGHSLQKVEGYAATCTSNGLTDGEKCVKCGKFTIPQEVIKATGHTEQKLEGYAATCTSNGLTDGSRCTTCGKTLTSQVVLGALGHVKETVPAVEPTCTEVGLTSGEECRRCGETLKEQQTVAAKGHTLVKVPEIAATCKMPGETEGEKCSVCGTYTIPTQLIPPAHKSVIDEAVAATCLKSGLTAGEHCSACGEIILAQTEVAALGHSDGDGDGVCERCQLPLNFADFIANNSFTKTEVTTGELAVGNVYRVYYDYLPAREDGQPESIWSPQILKFSNGTQIHSSYAGNGVGQIMSISTNDMGVDYPAEYCVAGEDAQGKYYDYLIVEGLTFELNIDLYGERETFTFTADMTVAAFDEGVYRLEALNSDYTFVEVGNYTLKTVEVGETVVGNWYRLYREVPIDEAGGIIVSGALETTDVHICSYVGRGCAPGTHIGNNATCRYDDEFNDYVCE